MTVLKSFVKESNAVGNKLEARVLKNPDGGYKVQHYVNDSFKTEVLFNESHTLPQVERHAQSWLNEVQGLNG
jgi:hypothetical protein